MKNIEVFKSSEKDIEISHKVDLNYSQALTHIHSKYEIYFSCCGGNKFLINNGIYNINKHDVFLFSNTDVHKINVVAPGAYDRYVIMFSPEIISDFSKKEPSVLECFDKKANNHCHKISLTNEKAGEFLALLNKMLLIDETQTYSKNLKLQLILVEILLFFNQEKQVLLSDSGLYMNSANDKKINDIINYINQNFTSPLTLESIAEVFFINKYYLCRLFKAKTNFGIADYIQSCRLSHSIPMLQKGAPVSEAAIKSGFSSDTYFISCFKKALGVSPKKFSLQHGRKHELM